MEKAKTLELNLPQLFATQSPQKEKFLEWGRGAGKSFVLAYFMRKMAKEMPRAKFALVGVSYTQILNVTLPSTKEGLEAFGLYEGIDYVVGCKPDPKLRFQMPFQKPKNFDNFILFANGAGFHMVSQDKPGSGRGLNTYGVIGDEAALLDPEKLFNDVQTTNRAKKAQFEHSSLLNAEIYASTTPMTKRGRWFIEKEKMARKHPKDTLFLRSSAKANRQNLAPDWFEKMKRNTLSEMHYNAEILNIRPKQVADGFYSSLDPDKHYYKADYDYSQFKQYNTMDHRGEMMTALDCRIDSDVNPKLPLIISVDWGARINSMVVMQDHGDVIRVLKNFYVKQPKILDHLFIEEFLPYYRHHKNKTVHFYYDRNGNSRVANSNKTYAEQAMDHMRGAAWKVVQMSRGLDPYHNDKQYTISKALRGIPGAPAIAINENNCEELIVSLENTEVKEERGLFKKDKSSERSKVIPQEHATHLTDAFDIPIFSLYKSKVRNHRDDGWQPSLAAR